MSTNFNAEEFAKAVKKSKAVSLKDILENDPEFANEHIQSVEEVKNELKEMVRAAKDEIKKKKENTASTDEVSITKDDTAIEEKNNEVPSLDDFIKDELKDFNFNKGETEKFPTFKDALDNIEKNIPAEMRNSPQYEKFLGIKARFLKVANFNYLLKYRLDSFVLPHAVFKLKKLKEKKKFINSYIKIATAKLQKSKKFMFTDPNKAFHKFILAADNKIEKDAFYNFFIVLCHFITTKDLSVHAYAIIYTLNRMMMFKNEYDKEDLEMSSDIASEGKVKELNYHELKQSIIENYSGDILRWKKGKITTPPFSDKVAKMEIKSSLTVID